MNEIRILLVRLAAALQHAQAWHNQMLTHPVYRAAMHVAAGLLIGQFQIGYIRQWLSDALRTATA